MLLEMSSLLESESIKTFVILDVEVNDNHQLQFNQCSLTEICCYAIAAKYLENKIINGSEKMKTPTLPRAMHKLNLMINPLRRINANTRTGLDNYMLENEPPFNDDTADCILKFLSRLDKPICLVAHYGWGHDYRILRHVYEKLNRNFPSEIFWVDSYYALREIDKFLGKPLQPSKENIKENENKETPLTMENNNPNLSTQICDENTSPATKNCSNSDTIEETPLSRQTLNETTPTRAVNCEKNSVPKPSKTNTAHTDNMLKNKSKRQLDFGHIERYSYKLGRIYEALFEDAQCGDLHQAERDVQILAQIILRYGQHFYKYANENKKTFDQIPMLGQQKTFENI
ncbi:uncharacterized protein LOC106082054 isoform X1 [Stomoxys calcitrans]|uniref:uncharacterized protein LOC106082054 isoform X1 n=1 Tax=Stomoxys calcitrans TaxID=35570 RepID=UPI0027E39AAD|nr:uncharacterized protein LOC106082054 isoform X1 [Stomoxys calcitrans]